MCIGIYVYPGMSWPFLCGSKVTLEEEEEWTSDVRVQELCESRGGRPGLPVPNSPYGLCGRKAALYTLQNGQSAGAV